MPTLILKPDFAVSPSGKILAGPIHIECNTALSQLPLPKKMLLPGFINTHSHALQRALRGRVEKKELTRPKGDFWSWRETMYRDVLSFDLDAIEAIATWCYLDLVKSGFVAVAEFHYVHHDLHGTPYKDPTAVSQRLLAAAKKVGIRLVLLQTAYSRNAFEKPALPEQKRFVFGTASEFLQFARHIRENLHGELLTHGLAIHSVRACSSSWIEAVALDAKQNELPLHVHACEQLKEIESCVNEHGIKPIALLHRYGALSSATTLVHATHIDPHDIAFIAKNKSLVSLCPSTEKNLGDGLCPIAELHGAGVRLCIGTDQHVRTDIADELRSIEENERLRLHQRQVLNQAGDFLANALVPIGSRHGFESLYPTATDNRIAWQGDFVAVKIPYEAELFGPEVGLDAWLLAGSSHDVTDVFIAGNHIVKDGIHIREREIMKQVGSALKRHFA